MKTSYISLVIAFALVVLLPISAQAEPLGTTFTYQGRILDTNEPANGLYDLQFRLYDYSDTGSQIGSDVNVPDVNIIDGYFTVELDFDSNVFDGNERWLEIIIRPGESVDPNDYTFLVPRQKITATPYALYAKTAGLPWQTNGINIFYNDGNVGIGTPWPESRLSIDQPGPGGNAPTVQIGPRWNNGSSYNEGDQRLQIAAWGGSAGLSLAQHNVGGFLLENASSDLAFKPGWDGSWGEKVRITRDGDVGIGTSTPSAKLDIIEAKLSYSPTLRVYNSVNEDDHSCNSLFEAGKVSDGGSFGIRVSTDDNRTAFGPSYVSHYGGYFSVESEYVHVSESGGGNYSYGVYSKVSGNPNVEDAVYGENASVGCIGALGCNDISLGALCVGVVGRGWTGVKGLSHEDGGIGVYGKTTHTNSYASYFEGGKNYFQGNVGINTTNPSSKLDVNGDINTAVNYKIGGTTVLSTPSTNTFSGCEAGHFNTTGSGNVFLGYQAGYYATDSNKLYIANSSGIPLIYGDFSTKCVGIGSTHPDAALEIGQSGNLSFKASLGTDAGDIFFQTSTGVQKGRIWTEPSDLNKLYLSSSDTTPDITVNELGHVGVGTTDPGSFTLAVNGSAAKPGGGSWSVFSDQRMKKNIRPLSGVLDNLLLLHGVSFEYAYPNHFSYLPGQQRGMIAQEVEQVFPEWVSQDADGYKSITFRGFESLTVEALRDLRTEKDAQIEELKYENRVLEERLAALEATIQKITSAKGDIK